MLNVLAGRVQPTRDKRLSGDIYLGAQKIDSQHLKERVSYVMQDDTMFSTLNVQETLKFSVVMRIPGISNEEADARVRVMLKKLRLENCSDTLVGNPMVKGISGGEKKRLAVGVELIVEPSLLFLDEPTSGLDSFSALTCINLLQDIAKSGTAVLCTIHQPSSEIFNKFTHTILIHAGRIVYGGTVNEVAAHFSRVGKPVPDRWNPADYMLYAVQMTSGNEEVKKICMKEPSNDEWKTKASIKIDEATSADIAERGEVVMGGIELQETSKSGGAIIVPSSSVSSSSPLGARRGKLGVFSQTYHLFFREVRGTSRDKGYLIGRFGITAFLFLLFGLVFLGVAGEDDTDPDNLNSHWNAITFLCISAMFGSAQPVLLQFPFERPVFIREVSANMYSTPSYFLSKLAIELPLSFTQALIQTTLAYFLMELQGSFILIVLTFWILGLSASSVAVMLGCMTSDTKKAMEGAPLVFVPQILFAGVFIQLEQVPVFLRWCQYLCSLKYAVNLFSIVEFADCDLASCDNRFEDNDIDGGDAWVWNAGALFGLFIVFRLIGFFFLDRSAKYVF
eukprot:g4516.t1